MKKLRIIFISTFLLIIYIYPILTLLEEDGSKSILENRNLEKLKPLDSKSILSGEYFESLEKYLLDHVFERELLMSAYGKINSKVLGKKILNNVVFGKDDMLLPERNKTKTQQYDSLNDLANRITNAAKDLNKSVEEYGGNLYYLSIPDREIVYSDKYPDYHPFDSWYLKKKRILINEKLEKENIKNVDVTELMLSKKDEDYIYYNTDHHYTYKGGYYTYLELIKVINQDNPQYNLSYPKWEDMNITRSEVPFFGSYSKAIADLKDSRGDYLEYAFPKDFPEYKRYEEGKQSSVPLVNIPIDSEITGYYTISGNKPNTVVKTNREELPNILIIGYSFTNPLEVIATYNFNEMHSIDPRYYKNNINDYIKEKKPDVVVIVRDDLYEGNKDNVAKIK